MSTSLAFCLRSRWVRCARSSTDMFRCESVFLRCFMSNQISTDPSCRHHRLAAMQATFQVMHAHRHTYKHTPPDTSSRSWLIAKAGPRPSNCAQKKKNINTNSGRVHAQLMHIRNAGYTQVITHGDNKTQACAYYEVATCLK